MHLSMLAPAICAEAHTHLAIAVKLLPLATSTRHFLHSLVASDALSCVRVVYVRVICEFHSCGCWYTNSGGHKGCHSHGWLW